MQEKVIKQSFSCELGAGRPRAIIVIVIITLVGQVGHLCRRDMDEWGMGGGEGGKEDMSNHHRCREDRARQLSLRSCAARTQASSGWSQT